MFDAIWMPEHMESSKNQTTVKVQFLHIKLNHDVKI